MAENTSCFVQQLAERKGEEIPNEFFHNDGFPEAIDAPASMWTDHHLIDFSLLTSSSPAAEPELAKLRAALSSSGCFLLINHGIESSLLEEVIQVGKQFFELPLEQKLRSSSTAGELLQGYSTDPITKVGRPSNWNDRLFLTLHPKEMGNPLIWPEKPQRFREVVDEYTRNLITVTETIYKAIARSINLEEESFLKPTKNGFIVGRLTLYPICPCPEKVLGSAPHLDGTTVTIILTDAEGLQVEVDGQWFKVPVVPGALFFNLGDFLEVMTNGILKSAMHRVVTNAAQERISIGAFCTAEPTYQIGPLSEFVTGEKPAKYKTFTGYEYMQVLYESFALGLQPLDALRL